MVNWGLAFPESPNTECGIRRKNILSNKHMLTDNYVIVPGGDRRAGHTNRAIPKGKARCQRLFYERERIALNK